MGRDESGGRGPSLLQEDHAVGGPGPCRSESPYPTTNRAAPRRHFQKSPQESAPAPALAAEPKQPECSPLFLSLAPDRTSCEHPRRIAADACAAAPDRAPAPVSLAARRRARVGGHRGRRRRRGGPRPGGPRAGAGPRQRPPQRLLRQPRPRPRLYGGHLGHAPRLLRRARAPHRRRPRRPRRHPRQARAFAPTPRCASLTV